MTPGSDPERNDIREPRSQSKLSRLIDTYELDELGEQLEAYWLAESEDRYRLRELAAYVNHRLLHVVMQNAGMNPLGGDVENTYRLLIDDDVSLGMRPRLAVAWSVPASMSTNSGPTSSCAKPSIPI